MSLTQATLDLVKSAQSAPDQNLAKSISTATGLVAYDLQAPAKNLYPVNTPIRNIIPRIGGGIGTATNWRVVQQIIGSGFDAMGWVKEGQRSGRMSYQTANKSASFVTLGEEDSITHEAINAGLSFEDLRATMVLRLLQKMMLKEESALLGGNASVALGTPVTPTLSAAGSGATLPTATYSVSVVALTYEGHKNSSVAAGVATQQVITGADGNNYTLSGGSSNKSAAATQAITLGQVLSVSTTAVNGAVAYAWYVGLAGAEKLEKITTINSATFTAALAGTGQALSSITADNSTNTLAYDGLLSAAFAPSSGAYVRALATGTPGTGTVLTSSGKGSVVEIDTMLQSMWDNYQVSPDQLWVNSQELKNITSKVLNGSSAPLLRFNTSGSDPYAFVANGVVEWYFNPFHANGGVKMPIKIHPMVPAGTIIGWSGNLPVQYQNSNVPNVAELRVRKEYHQIDWPLRTRMQEVGVYLEAVLAVYFPAAMGILTNVADG